jgi:uncharacterized protein
MMSAPRDDFGVVDDSKHQRFVFEQDGFRGELVYRRDRDRIVLVHTGVPDELAGHGVGGRLVRAAVARAAAEHLTVVPWCPFARAWLLDHPDVASSVTIDWSPPPGD